MTEIYRNYQMYNSRGRRLAIFAKKTENYTEQNPEVEFCAYECSLSDNFSKKKAFAEYIGDTSGELKPNCFRENVKFVFYKLNKFLENRFYKKVYVNPSIFIDNIPMYCKNINKGLQNGDYFFVNKKHKVNKEISIKLI